MKIGPLFSPMTERKIPAEGGSRRPSSWERAAAAGSISAVFAETAQGRRGLVFPTLSVGILTDAHIFLTVGDGCRKTVLSLQLEGLMRTESFEGLTIQCSGLTVRNFSRVQVNPRADVSIWTPSSPGSLDRRENKGYTLEN